jgi:tetratricopeptide (TPR) repeat protein
MDSPSSTTDPPHHGNGGLGSAASVLARGTIIDRYVVLKELGAGGMGVVYVAYDPELDRNVALKLLRPGIGADKGRARLLREAQALAKLAHPHVVAIHDVGTLGEQVWLAMELVQGQTLSAWLRVPRGWREVLGVMRSAGEGLVAAHAAGLLHRDFKPDNVMVGDDGRVRVMDFGLARARPENETLEPDAGQPLPTVETMAMPITQTGAIVGTPSHMAPEQFANAELTAAADQFAFCVTLWQAIYGERPFGGRTLAELYANVSRGRRRPPPKGRRVPSRLRRACERGLSIDPQQRWPSMTELLRELRGLSDPRRRGLWAVGLAGGLTAVGVGLVRYAEVGFRCQGAAAWLDGVWDPAREQEVKQAILGTGLSYAPDTWVRVEQGLDAYAGAWVAKHTDVCEATSVRQEQSTEVMDLRMECLRTRRVALREAVGVLVEPDTRRVERAVELVAALPGLSRCDDLEALRAGLPPPEDPVVAEEVQGLRDRLATVGALWDAGAYARAQEELEPVQARAEALGYEPLLAEVALWRGRLHGKAARYADAEGELERAYRLALRHAHGEVELDAAIELLLVVGISRGYDAAERWIEEARGRADRRGASARARSWLFNNVGVVLADQGDFKQAKEQLERALAIKQEALGPLHVDVAITLSNLGLVHSLRGDLDQALETYGQVLAIWEKTIGPRHPYVIPSLNIIGMVLHEQGKPAEALELYQRALAMGEEALGPTHLEVAMSLGGIGDVLYGQGRLTEALEAHQRALAIREALLGSFHDAVASSLVDVGNVLRGQGRLSEARAHLRRALAAWEQTMGPDHVQAALALVGLARVGLDELDHEDARVHAERALALREANETPPALVAQARFVLARSLWPDPSERDRARALAERARETYATLGAAGEEQLAEVRAWLAEHEAE